MHLPQAKARSMASESIESDQRSSARKWSLSLRLVRPLLGRVEAMPPAIC